MSGFRGVVESANQILHGGHASPNGSVHIFYVGRGRHAVFIEFSAVAQDVFRDITQVDVELARVVGEFLIGEWVHQPELNIFDVGGLKVGRLHLAHDTAPTALWVVKFTIGVDTGGVLGRIYVVVVWTAFIRVVGQVEHRHVGLGACGNVLGGEDFGFKYLTHSVLREFVIGDVGRSVVVVAVVEDRVVNDVPRQASAVFAVVEARVGSGFREEVGLVLWRASHVPQGGQTQVDGRLGTFKIVDIRGVALGCRLGEARDEAGKLTVHPDARGCLGFDARQGIDEAGQPAGFGIIAEVGTVDGVGDGFLAVVDFLSV